jgi:peptidoglycan/LPS O-acetylase OafA/YrhL
MEIELLGSFFLFAFLALVGKSKQRGVFYLIVTCACWALGLTWILAFLMGAWLSDRYSRGDQQLDCCRGKIDLKYLKLDSNVSGVSVLLLSCILIGLPNYHGLFHLVLAVGATVFVLKNRLAKRIFGGRCSLFLGKIFFGLYLGHPLVIAVLGYPVFTILAARASTEIAALLACLLLTIFSLLFGWTIWFFGDKPAVAISKRIGALFR